jgi:hypothetical protein
MRFSVSSAFAVLHITFWYFILFLCFQIVHLGTYISIFPKVTPFLFPYRNLKSYSFGQMLYYLLKKIKFEYIELQEILFYNYKINVVVFQYDVYENGNILEPEIIPILFNLHWYGLISIETLKFYFLCMFLFKFPQISPQFMSLAYSFSHFSFALGNAC